MVRRIIAITVLLTTLFAAAAPADAQLFSAGCSKYDNWIWAQTEFDQLSTVSRDRMDPDGNGIACEELLNEDGFAPAIWVSSIPTDVEPAAVTRVIDGDTIDVVVDGREDRVRLYRADAPEPREGECGAEQATKHVEWLLSLNDESVVYLQYDATKRDPYDRRLAYVWLNVDGRPYLLNEAIVRSGWAVDKDYGDRLWAGPMEVAQVFARGYGIGGWSLCPAGLEG